MKFYKEGLSNFIINIAQAQVVRWGEREMIRWLLKPAQVMRILPVACNCYSSGYKRNTARLMRQTINFKHRAIIKAASPCSVAAVFKKAQRKINFCEKIAKKYLEKTGNLCFYENDVIMLFLIK